MNRFRFLRFSCFRHNSLVVQYRHSAKFHSLYFVTIHRRAKHREQERLYFIGAGTQRWVISWNPPCVICFGTCNSVTIIREILADLREHFFPRQHFFRQWKLRISSIAMLSAATNFWDFFPEVCINSACRTLGLRIRNEKGFLVRFGKNGEECNSAKQ